MRKKIVVSLLVLLVLGGLAGLGAAWVVFGANTPGFDGERGVKIPPGSSFAVAVDSLRASGILASAKTFRWVGQASGWGNQIKAGYYTFESGASNYDMLSKLRRGLQTPISLTIPPGTRPEVMAAVAGRDMAFTAADFANALADTALAARLGTDVAHLFGYMLPDTYNFYWLTDAPDVVARIKQTFDAFYDDGLAGPAAQHDLTKDDVLSMASIVEWETSLNEEKPRVAGVYLNRLRIGMKLDADPTVQFAVLEREGQKRRLLYQDYRIAHPYNTYTFSGLPPGPITNPSRSSLRAAAQPEDHNYFFFVARGDGGHTFSRTLAEHNRAARQFHQLMEQRRREQGQQ